MLLRNTFLIQIPQGQDEMSRKQCLFLLLMETWFLQLCKYKAFDISWIFKCPNLGFIQRQ